MIGNCEKAVKDFYIVPLASHRPIPQVNCYDFVGINPSILMFVNFSDFLLVGDSPLALIAPVTRVERTPCFFLNRYDYSVLLRLGPKQFGVLAFTLWEGDTGAVVEVSFCVGT